ncbi:hypothetical protein QCA50_001422 [Cerrena zonata]|uniref:DUF7702 domain-containing protein n=1 Tax=Cerrena zonata TaxID=2478898 RepID=A0AAW0GVT8_9APHY
MSPSSSIDWLISKGLDERGYIAIVELIIYTPIFVTSGFLIFRHGFRRNAGWIYLLILSIVRIAGGSIRLASELGNPHNETLKIVFDNLEAAGVSQLLLATVGFLHTIAQHAFGSKMTHLLQLFDLISTISLVLLIIGETKITGADGDQSKLDAGITLKHTGDTIFLALYVLIVITHGIYWLRRQEIMKNRRKLLLGISIALPFLAVRVVYSVLSSYAPHDPDAESGLAIFNISSGTWYIYLIMGVLAELIVVLIYTFFGMTVPLDEDYASTKMERWEGEEDRQYMRP